MTNEKKRNLMKKAVEMAKRMTGDWLARMSFALKMVWADEKGSIGKDERVETAKKVWNEANEYEEAPQEVKELFDSLLENETFLNKWNKTNKNIKMLIHSIKDNFHLATDDIEVVDIVEDWLMADGFDEIM